MLYKIKFLIKTYSVYSSNSHKRKAKQVYYPREKNDRPVSKSLCARRKRWRKKAQKAGYPDVAWVGGVLYMRATSPEDCERITSINGEAVPELPRNCEPREKAPVSRLPDRFRSPYRLGYA